VEKHKHEFHAAMPINRQTQQNRIHRMKTHSPKTITLAALALAITTTTALAAPPSFSLA